MIKYILNDQIVDQDKAKVHVSDLALLRAYGIFDFFRLVDLQPLFIEDHLNRFFNSADILRLICPVGRKRMRALILELISINRIRNSGIRIVLTGGESPNGYSIGNPTLIIINEPINPLPESHFSAGVKLISHEYQRDIPEAKTINYVMGIYKMPQIKESGSLDLLYHWNGKISELTRSNFFIVDKDDKIVTPGNGVLKGVNRKHVLNISRKKFEVEERDLFMEELAFAKEAFITGTTKKVMPVYQIDELVIGNGKPGPVTQELQKMFEKYVDRYFETNKISKYNEPSHPGEGV